MSLKHPKIVGVILIFLSSMSFVVMNFTAKYLLKSTNIEMIIFFRFSIALLCCIAFLATQKHVNLHTQFPLLHIARAIFGFLSLATLIFSVQHIPTGIAILLNLSYPMFIPFLLLLFGKQQIRWQFLAWVILGFVGVSLILHTEFYASHFAYLVLALASGLFMAFSTLLTQELLKTESTITIGFYLFLITTLISSLFAYENWQTPPWPLCGLLCLVGISGFIYQQAMALGISKIGAEYASPLMYSSVPISSILDLIYFNNPISWQLLLGELLIFIAVSCIIWFAYSSPKSII